MQKFENTLWSGKCLSGEMSSRGSVRSGNCPFGEMSVGEVSVGEVSVGDLSSGKCQPGKCWVGKLSYNHLFALYAVSDWNEVDFNLGLQSHYCLFRKC